MNDLRRLLPVAAILLLLAAGVIWMVGSGGGTKTVTAYFPRAVSIYEGSDVRVLGVAIGQVDEVVPEGTQVKVVMTYDEDVDVPQDAQAGVGMLSMRERAAELGGRSEVTCPPTGGTVVRAWLPVPSPTEEKR